MSDDNGISWFEKAMADTKPLKNKNKKHVNNIYEKSIKINNKTIIQPKSDNNITLEDIIYKSIDIQPFYTEEIDLILSPECHIEFKHPSINYKLFKNIKNNDFILDSYLDLHGFTILESAELLRDFITGALYNKYRFIKIITGKGQHAKLKNYVAMWLEEIPYILAFTSAPAAHGGRGAIIVYLKKL
tara:strand:- start:12848 stop:13408 length:561 start_codon:yes stop_codon:yes gene_type:complete